jgi:hypothetical protein
MGQRPYPMVYLSPEDSRGWIGHVTSPKDDEGQPELPFVWSGYREERDWSLISHHLHTSVRLDARKVSVEYIIVNVGGPCVEGSSPPMKRRGVGGVIVLGGRESRLQGEGRQGIDTPKVDISRHMLVKSGRTCGGGDETKWDDKSCGNTRGGRSVPGEPDAVKVARPVRRGG